MVTCCSGWCCSSCQLPALRTPAGYSLLRFFSPQVDYLLRRLVLLSERTAATEALLSIEMDHRRWAVFPVSVRRLDCEGLRALAAPKPTMQALCGRCRNELVALDLLVTCVTGAFAFVSMVAGILGMNLPFGAWAQSQVRSCVYEEVSCCACCAC